MSPVINWKPYKMPPVPITSWKRDRRQCEACIGGYLLCLAKGGDRKTGGARTGWSKGEVRSQSWEIWGLGLKSDPPFHPKSQKKAEKSFV